MKKRILSILLTLCMVLCLVPITVFAAGGAKAILPGTSAQSILKIDKSRLSFAGHEWWVIGQKTDKSNNAPIITLLAVNNDFGDVPFRTGSAVPFENARRYSEDNGYYANNPSDMSQWRKPNEYAGSTLQQKMVSLAEAIPEKEQAVIRPKDITEGITGQEVKAQKLWAFSQEDSIYLYRNSCKYAAQWWTRSSNEVYGYGSWTIHPDGRSGSALNVDYDAAVRPAMEMDLSSVLFISAAEHGKVADLTTPIAEYAGDEWKLTLHDSDRDDFTAKTVLVNGSVLEVEYKNAKVGDNEYISAVIKDADGSISRYTRVVQLDGTTNGTRGRAAIDLTGIDMTGKTLCVFNEQFNGDHKTDYAGALREVKLTDEIDEQFTLAPGGRYYFDLSAMNIPGTANGGNSDGAVSLPDTSLHYVPFTYVGTIEAYKLTSATATTEEYAQQNKYPHSLFVADYAVTHTISWGGLNDEGLIFGKNYASGGVDYTLRAPSTGSDDTGSGESQHVTPSNNEWDRILNKNSGYIQNWNEMYSWGQDTVSFDASGRAVRGYSSARYWISNYAMDFSPRLGFRPVLEVLNADKLDSGGLKVVTLDLNGGKLGGSSEDIHIIVKTGSEFTAPASDGLNRPDGDTGNFFMWRGSNGKFYVPGDSVPADVTALTVQWTDPTYAVTLHPNGGTINNGNVTEYIYGVGATLPTADDMTYTGHTFKGWYDNEGLTGDPVTAIGGTEMGNKEYWAKWEINQYTITFDTAGGSEIAPITQDYGTAVTAPEPPAKPGYTFTGWNPALPATMPAENLTVTAQWTVNQYTITFDTAGGSAIAPITQDYGTAITAPAAPTREGYTFTGWDKTIPATMPAGDMTITAQWTVNQYTITYDLDGGTAEGNPDTYTVETDAFTLKNPTRPGYTFTGWSGTGLTGEDNLTVTIPKGSTGNRSYTAHWSLNTYPITYDLNGGTASGNPTSYTVESATITLNQPTKTGYTFTGWSGTDLTGEDNLTVTIPAGSTGDRSYTAHWSLNTYSITYDLNGGTVSGNPDFYTVESAAITLNQPTRIGYTFTGWSGTNLTGEDNLTVTIPTGSIGDRSYTAHWSLNTYSITYDLDGGTAFGNPDSYTVESAAITLNEPTKAGYVFTGWSGTDLVGEDNLTVTIPAGSIGDRRYTAHWEFDPTIIAALNPTPNVDFLDVSRVDWFYYDVRYVCENGLMNGTSRNRFSPYGTATRGMLVTILYRMENEPRCFGSAAFSDVKPGAYYEKAVVWASQNNIVSGYTDGTFRPDAPVTREQLASILYRYTLYRGQDVSAGETTSLTGYGNAQAVSSYALPAMRWACGTGILQGANGKLNPSGLATRAQLAAMLHRYLTK